MANLKITNVPQASSVTTSNDFYAKIGTTFRRVPISALVTLIESEIDFTPEPNFNQKFLAMKLQNGVYVIDEANSDFDGSDYQTFAQFVAAIYNAHSDGYEVFCRIFDGQYENAVPYLGFIGSTALKFGGWELSADGLQPVVYTYTETYGFVREVIQMGGGGTADVTPTAVATAIAGMSAQQKSDSRTNLGAEVAGAAATVQGNLDAVTAKIPSDASSSNKMATQADLPVFSARNATTDTVEVKKDPISKKLYVPASSGSSGGEGGGTPTWEDILPEGGIPQTDLAKETVTITASGDPVTYTSSKSFSEISAAKTAGKEIEVFYNGFKGNCMDVGQNAATFEVTDATLPDSPIKYIFVISGTGCAGAASVWGSSGGGAEVFDVTITTSPAASTKTAAEIYAAKQAGKIIRATIDGNDATLLAQSFNNEAIFYSIETDSGRVLMSITVSDINNSTTVTGVSWPIGNADEPYTGTPAEPTTGNFTISVVADNTIYSVGETASLTVGTWTNNRRFTLIFISGSSPTSLVWANDHEPVWPPNFDGTPVANTRYEINVENGYAVVGAWEVSS